MLRRLPNACWVGLFLLLTACGGGESGPDPDPDPDPDPQPPAGTAVIGAAGGEVMTADTSVVLTIPAGALSTETTISITEEDATEPGTFGKVYRLEPAGLQFSAPVTIEVGRDSATIGDAVPATLGLAFQDETGSVVANPTSELVADGSVTTARVPLVITRNWYMALSGFWTNLPRYVMVRRFWDFRPQPMQVQAGRTITIEVLACLEEEDVNSRWPRLRSTCSTSIRQGTWRVRPAVGNSSNLGTVVSGTPSSTARYTAPAQRPQIPLVVVEASLTWEARGVTAKLPIGVAILPAASAAGSLDWSWSGSNSKHEERADGKYSYDETVSDNGSGNAFFEELGGFGGYAWRLKSWTYESSYLNVITIVNVGSTCTTTIIETVERTSVAGTVDVGWIAVVLPMVPSQGMYTLQPGTGSYEIRERRSKVTKTACPGAPDIIVSDPEVIDSGTSSVTLRPIVERSLGSPDQRQFSGNDSWEMTTLSTGHGLDYTRTVSFNWDLLFP